MKPIVAIIGRQNVGKSTLLNRMAGKQISIVTDVPGTTRDRIFADVTWNNREFTVVDTGGLVSAPESHIDLNVEAQVQTAVADADIIIFVTDAKGGPTPLDEDIAQRLRRTRKPAILAANKADNEKLRQAVPEFYRLGLGDPIPISAYHREGLAELLDRISSLIPEEKKEEILTEGVKIAILGHPGVGKSMLLNALIGSERVVVGETPGTTRDAVDTTFDFHGRNVILIDTAGIRRRGRVAPGIERFSVIRSFRAIDRCDTALLVLDALEVGTAQDTHIAGYIREALKGIIILVNKWDLVENRNKREYTEAVKEKFKFLPYAPLLFISARTKEGVDKVLPQALMAYEERQKKVPDEDINRIINSAITEHVPPTTRGKHLRVYAAIQSEVNPPGFTIKVNDPKFIHFSYRRYLENRIRESFGFKGTPVRLTFKTGR